MTDHDTIDEIESGTVRTLIPKANTPEIREYNVDTMKELSDLVYAMQNPDHVETLIDVEVQEVFNP